MKRINKNVKLINVDDYRDNKNRQRLQKICATLIVSVVFVFSVTLFINLYKYEKFEIYSSTDTGSMHNFKYKKFNKGTLEYNVSGISYIELDGKERWNYQWNIKSPMISVNKNALAAVDLNGFDIYIFNSDKFISHFKTKRRILKAHILSTTDILILSEGENGYFINIYKASGDIILETKSSITSNGYIIDFNFDESQKYLIIAYLHIDKNTTYSTLNCYDLSNYSNKEKIIKTFQYNDEIISKVFVTTKNIYTVSDKNIIRYDLSKDWSRDNKSIINSYPRVFQRQDKIITLEDGQKGVDIRVYDENLKQLLYKTINTNYNDVRVFDDEICLIKDNKLIGYKFNARKEYELNFDDKIWDVDKIADKNYVISQTNKTLKIKLKLF